MLVSVGAIWTKGLNFDFSAGGPSPRIPLKYLWLALAVESAACMGMYLCVGRYGPFSEAEYEINGISLLSLGKLPNIDFEWAYGLGFFTFRNFGSQGLLHINIPDAYFLFWAFASLAGIILLFATVNLIDFSSRYRTFIFLVFCIPAILSVLNMGVHYSLLRFVCPLFLILLTYNSDRQSHEPPAKLVTAVITILSTVVLALISPEVTIAYAFACAIVLFPGKWSAAHPSRIVVYLSTMAALALLFACGLKFHVFDILRTQARGSNGFPIVFAPATAIFACVVFICACYLVPGKILVNRKASGTIRSLLSPLRYP